MLAGTRVSEVVATLGEQGQYLPFDPLLADSGATIGGTVASNASGPGRFRFGGIRDFLLGVRFVDGRGNCIRGGGQVVKNAAGFDYPKLLVGSQGKLGLIYELTFKVFPRPESYATLISRFDRLGRCVKLHEPTCVVRDGHRVARLDSKQEECHRIRDCNSDRWDRDCDSKPIVAIATIRALVQHPATIRTTTCIGERHPNFEWA